MREDLDAEDVATMGRQAAKSKATRDKIINAVISLIKQGGFAAASSTRIARHAGVSWGAVQHHFGGKEEILAAVLERSHVKYSETLGAAEFTRGDAKKRISMYVQAAWEHYQGEEYMATLEILLAARGHGRATQGLPVTRSRDDHLQLGRRIFHDSTVSDNQMREAIYTVHCMLTGILIEMALEPQTFDPRPYTKRLKSVLQTILY